MAENIGEGPLQLIIEAEEDEHSSSSRKRSLAWDHFSLDGAKRVKCFHCNKRLSYNQQTTSNLWNHLKSFHPTKLKGDEHSKPDSLPDNLQLGFPIDNSQQKMETTNPPFSFDPFSFSLIKFFVKQDLDPRVIQSKEFKELIGLLNPHVNLLGVEVFKNQLLQTYAAKDQIVKQSVERIDSRISFSTDNRSSDAKVSFLSIFAHFVDANWNMNSLMLDFRVLPENYTGSDIHCLFMDVVNKKFNIKHQKLGITLKSDTPNDEFTQLLIQNDEYFDSDHRFECFLRVLNDAVSDTLLLVRNPISKLRKSFLHIRCSTPELESFKVIYSQHYPSVPFVNPIVDVVDRWITTVEMMQCALKIKNALNAYVYQHKCREEGREGAGVRMGGETGQMWSENELKEEDWHILEKTFELLRPFCEAVDMLSAETFATLSTVIPVCHSLFDDSLKFLNSMPEPNDLVRVAAMAARSRLNSHYNKMSRSCNIATVLDPRLKLEYFESCTEGDGHTHGLTAKELSVIVRNAYLRQYAPTLSSDVHCLDYSETNSMKSRIFKKRGSGSSEFDAYVQEPTIDGDIHPLAWWKANERRFPTLSRMARDYLAIPGSSICRDAIFSPLDRVVTHFDSFSPEFNQAIMCLKQWL